VLNFEYFDSTSPVLRTGSAGVHAGLCPILDTIPAEIAIEDDIPRVVDGDDMFIPG
jgi:hypothetical protein